MEINVLPEVIFKIKSYRYLGNVIAELKEEFENSVLTLEQFTALGEFIKYSNVIFECGWNDKIFNMIYQNSGMTSEKIKYPKTKFDSMYNFIVSCALQPNPLASFQNGFKLINKELCLKKPHPEFNSYIV